MRGGSGNVRREEKGRSQLLKSTREQFKNFEMQKYDDKHTYYENRKQLLKSTKEKINQIEKESRENYKENLTLKYRTNNKYNTLIAARTKLDPITAQTEHDEDLLTCYLIKHYINDIENYRSIRTADMLFEVREKRAYLIEYIKKLKDKKDEARIRQSNLTIDKYDKIIKDLEEVLEHPYADGYAKLEHEGYNKFIKQMKNNLKKVKNGEDILSKNSNGDDGANHTNFELVSKYEARRLEEENIQISEAERLKAKRLQCNDRQGPGCEIMGGGGLEKKTKNERYKNSAQQKHYSNASY
jgi:hypothetical protein